MTTTKELSTTMPSSTFADVTTSSTPAVITIQITTQTILTTTKQKTMDTSTEETTEVTTTTVSTTTQPDIDWEKVNELDEQEAEKNTGISTPIFSSIMDTLMAIGSTIVYGVYQLYIPSNTTINSNVTSVIP